MTKCTVSRDATRQIEELRAYVALDDRAASERVVARICAIIDLLSLSPLMGRKTLRRGVRMFVVKPSPYIVYYRYSRRTDELVVVSVLHGAQRRPGLADEPRDFRRCMS